MVYSMYGIYLSLSVRDRLYMRTIGIHMYICAMMYIMSYIVMYICI